ncbi:MAG: DUF3313 family protein [Deltaproteobacteria bacterium]|nr:DUF3313 family protein [Deltaproteobacteria bacterium]
MRECNLRVNRLARPTTAGLIAAQVLIVWLAPTVFAEEGKTTVAFNGLEPIEGGSVAMAYIDPKADFSVFRRVKILDPYVAFRSNWQRDQNRMRRRSIRARDMERIRADVASLFKTVLTERLEADDGFEVVDEIDYDVLLLRPAIIDLDVSAPDAATAGRAQTFSASTGAATLYIQLFDSVSGKIIGRAADRRVVRNTAGTVTWSSRVTNTAEARRMFGRWADTLRGFLDQHYAQ